MLKDRLIPSRTVQEKQHLKGYDVIGSCDVIGNVTNQLPLRAFSYRLSLGNNNALSFQAI